MADDPDNPEPEPDLVLARAFAVIARTLLAEETLPATLAKICELAVATIDGCNHAGITLVQGRKLSTEGANDDVPGRVDHIQYEVNEGPCLDAIREHEVFRSDDLAREHRWPEFAGRAVEETGVHSMLGLRLFAEGDTMGSLNLYSKQTAAFDDKAVEVGSVFAAHAAVAMAGAKANQQMGEALRLQEALRSRDVIGQAKEILMARQHLTEDAAIELLKEEAQRFNIRLSEAAQRIATGAGPPASESSDTEPSPPATP